MERTSEDNNFRASFWRKVGAAYLLATVTIVTLVVLA